MGRIGDAMGSRSHVAVAVGASAAALVLLATALPEARASAVSAAEFAAREVAKNHFLAGRDHYLAGRYAGALDEFLRSREVMPGSEIAYNIARCHEHLGDRTKAIISYREYLRLRPDADDKEAIEARIEKLNAEIALSLVTRRMAGKHGLRGGRASTGPAGGRSPSSASP